MRSKLRFAGWLVALGISTAMASPCVAQRPHANPPPSHPPQPQKQQQQAPRQQQQQKQQQQQGQQARRNTNRPPQADVERANSQPHANNNPNRPPVAKTPPRNLSPQELRKNEQHFNQLTPQQKQDYRERAHAWNQLTPDQKNHIKNDVLPRWKQLPPERQRAIQQRLGVLKNMPESARNQHLNDPNFTRGMNEEDKVMLHDLSHLHVGGAPDPPGE
jgi:hypothetical protein